MEFQRFYEIMMCGHENEKHERQIYESNLRLIYPRLADAAETEVETYRDVFWAGVAASTIEGLRAMREIRDLTSRTPYECGRSPRSGL